MWHAVCQSDSLQRTGIVKSVPGQETMQAESVLQKARLASGQKSKGAAFGHLFFLPAIAVSHTNAARKRKLHSRKEKKYRLLIAGIVFKKMFCRQKGIGNRKCLIHIGCKDEIAVHCWQQGVCHLLPGVAGNIVSGESIVFPEPCQVAGKSIWLILDKNIGNTIYRF